MYMKNSYLYDTFLLRDTIAWVRKKLISLKDAIIRTGSVVSFTLYLPRRKNLLKCITLSV